MPQKIHQLVHTLSYGDAISGEVVAICRLLRSRGIQSEIFAINTHEKLRSWTRPYTELKLEPDSTIILHYSLGSPLNELFLNATGVRRITVYHNLTPDSWYKGYNARVVSDLQQGRDELPKILAASDLVLADSTYNKTEVVNLGFNRCEVLPLLLDDSKWEIPANAGIAAALKGHGGVNILHVGRTAPNKRLQDILKVFYFYHHKINQKSRLWLVGSDIDTEIYSFELRMLISELRLKEAVTMVGSVADSELKAFYENSDLYLCMSEHEGFCVPLLEAMYFGVPIVAYEHSAVPETLGAAGVVFSEKDYPLLAELVNSVVTDEQLKSSLIRAGKDRVQAFREAAFAKRLNELFPA